MSEGRGWFYAHQLADTLHRLQNPQCAEQRAGEGLHIVTAFFHSWQCADCPWIFQLADYQDATTEELEALQKAVRGICE